MKRRWRSKGWRWKKYEDVKEEGKMAVRGVGVGEEYVEEESELEAVEQSVEEQEVEVKEEG